MGSHLKPGRSRFAWEVTRYLLAWALVVSAVVGLFWLLQEVLPDVVGPNATSTTLAADTTTTAPVDTSTTVPAETTTTTIAGTTTTSSTVTTTTLPPVRPPEEVTVLVLNSTPRVGLAAGIAADLADLGYVVVQPANATPRRPVTVILHTEDFALEALALKDAAFEEDAIVGLDDEGRTTDDVPIVVILGDSFQP
ncbi:MAG: LytR C-terminal domain-containing protein [Acidimicrobiia bacterium]